MSRDITMNLIDVDPNNARQSFDEIGIAELAQSIAASGLAVPILVRPNGDRFTIVHGERRYRAVASLGWATIPADVRTLDAEQASWLALVENVQRADLSPIEEAQAYQAKLATGLTQADLGKRIGKSQSHIATKLRLLRLPEITQAGIHFGKLNEGHAKQLLRLDVPEIQHFFTCVIWRYQLTVAQVHERIDKLQQEAQAEIACYAEAWRFSEALEHDPDDSPLVQRYGRRTPTGMTLPANLSKEDWLYGLKQLHTIFKVMSIIENGLIDVGEYVM